jgi:mannose-1-phosphate guanylyltransferase
MTQELIHSANPAAKPRSVAPSIQTPSTIARLETDWGRIRAKTKPFRQPVQSTRLGEAPRRHCAPATRESHRWGIVLAGGDGPGLPTQSVWGDYRPKQFCPLLGNCTLLEDAQHRAQRSVPPEQILYVVTRAHEDYYLPILVERPSQRIVQPSDKGTAPAILSALMRIAQADPNAIVTVLPCDHYYFPESAFTATLESAFEIAEQQRSGAVVLLGSEPKSPEVEYGWIELGETIDGHSELFHVAGFREKPSLPLAEALFGADSLWNTFVMVGRVSAFLEMARAIVPSLLQALESWEVTLPSGEIRIPDAVYDRIASTDFSRQILSAATDRLLALRLANVEWCDLGDPYRVLVKLLERNGHLPSWTKLWPDVSSSQPAHRRRPGSQLSRANTLSNVKVCATSLDLASGERILDLK